MVAVQIRLALGAVDDELVHLADAAADLEGRREHRPAHADHTGLADALEDRVGIAALLGREGRQEVRLILVVVLNHDGQDHIAQRVRSRLHRHDGAGHARVDRRGDGRGIIGDLLTHLDIVALFHQRLAGRADMLRHWNDHLSRRRDLRDRDLGCFPIVGMYAAYKCLGHKASPHIILTGLFT